MPKTLTFSTGVKEYEINGTIVRFNPTDVAFFEDLYDTFTAIDALYKQHEQSAGFEGFRKLDRDICDKLDELLGEGVADSIFGGVRSYSLNEDTGEPLWVTLLFVCLDQVVEAWESGSAKTEGSVSERMRKYDALMARYRKGKK